MNPVLVREWRTFFRGRCPYYFLIVFGVLHLLTLYGVVVPVLEETALHMSILKHTGKLLAGRLFGLQLFLIAFTFPSLSVWSIKRERHINSHQLLEIIPYGRMKIIIWKFVTSIVTWMLLIVIILPLLLFSLSTGGISTGDLVTILGLLTAFLIICGVTALLCALVIKRPAHALAAAYFLVFTFSTACFSGWLRCPSAMVYEFLSFSF